jgi:hypothetical protein
MTRVELLYLDGCPNHEPLSARVRELLAGRGLPDAIELVRVDSHQEALDRGFLGSPSVRVDGADVEPGAGERDDYGLKCRLYHGTAGLAGVPDDAWILAALDRTGGRVSHRRLDRRLPNLAIDPEERHPIAQPESVREHASREAPLSAPSCEVELEGRDAGRS